MDWDQREREARQALQALDYLLGDWIGEGQAHDQPVRGRFVARTILGDTFIEARETLLDEAGQVDHQDLALYRFDADERQLKVMHLQAPAWTADHKLLPMEDGPGHRWFSSPFSPRVQLIPQAGGALQIEVWAPFQTVPDAVMRYVRA